MQEEGDWQQMTESGRALHLWLQQKGFGLNSENLGRLVSFPEDLAVWLGR
jgi:hypothetical protein